MKIADWILDSFSNVNTAKSGKSSQLEKQFLELTTNEKIQIKFKNGLSRILAVKKLNLLTVFYTVADYSTISDIISIIILV